jgi:alanyl-tRNA synthetase
MTSQDIRKQFLSFFEAKKHEIVSSAPIVIKNDPTLMFTNAGMNQFKEYFLGQKAVQYNRISDTQKCLRVSGKHNDLEEVGIDTYHHTMFEMLGNWSFGDYFKKEAIQWAWELLTEVYKIDKDKLYVSVFEGSKDADNLALDQEALDLWKSIVPEDKIIYGNKKDNFWEMGAQGPCGPCSEIHVDIRSAEDRAKVPGRDLVNEDHPEVIEVWNLVFMEFNRKADGSLENLPSKHVDTGMGFERLCMVLQDVKSNYDTDVFTPLIQQIQKTTESEYGKDWDTDVAIRVIADHLRAVAFAIADGQLPSNNGAGYVIRRILRRAIRYAYTFLNQKDAFIFELVSTLDKQMGEQFPELRNQKDLISKVIQEEEQSFLRTLGQGLSRLDSIVSGLKNNRVDGEKAFELYDTFGFPLDLTSLILREKNIELDEDGFKAEMEKQKSRSRAASQLSMEDWTYLSEGIETEFVGFDQLSAQSKIIQYRQVQSKKEGDFFQLVLDKTPFYAEGGGQVGDRGVLIDSNGNKTSIFNTKKENNLILHYSKKLPLQLEGEFEALTDSHKRKLTENNHSATHLLHHALREVLGSHVEQKGSLVNEKYLRFDFSHFSKVSESELLEIENRINRDISDNLEMVEHREIPMEEALEKGAMALFGEKYGDRVRMIEFGDSKELCGGTHVPNTGKIWALKISSESAVAAGIRRIEAITGDVARAYFNNQDNTVKEIKSLLKNNDPKKVILQIQSENTELKKQVEQLLKEKASGAKDNLKAQVKNIGGVNYLATKVDLDPASIKNLAFELGSEIDNLLFISGSTNKGKAMLTCYVDKKLVEEKNLDAGLIVRTLGKFIQGGGGGQKFFATAGGKNIDGLDQALKEAENFLN